MDVVFYEFTINKPEGGTVYINPLLVNYFTSTSPNNIATKIFFDNGNSIEVRCPSKEVEKILTVNDGLTAKSAR